MIIVGYSRTFNTFLTPSLTGTPTTYFASAQSETNPRTIAHTSTTGNVVMRIIGRTNSSTTIVPAVTWNGAAMTIVGLTQPNPAASGDCFAYGAVIQGGATGLNDLVISRPTPMGRYLVRIDDIANLPVAWAGHETVARAPSASNTQAVTSVPEGASSLLLSWGGVVMANDSSVPVQVDGAWTVNSQLNGDTVPDTSAHSRGCFASMTGGGIGVNKTATFTLSGAQTSATFCASVIELLGA
jgi:hypothetical protein